MNAIHNVPGFRPDNRVLMSQADSLPPVGIFYFLSFRFKTILNLVEHMARALRAGRLRPCDCMR